jgi:hypothetical protein
MEKSELNLEELKNYERILNGIISINIGVAGIPVERVELWRDLLFDWWRFQRENSEGIARFIRQFGQVDDPKSVEDEGDQQKPAKTNQDTHRIKTRLGRKEDINPNEMLIFFKPRSK